MKKFWKLWMVMSCALTLIVCSVPVVSMAVDMSNEVSLFGISLLPAVAPVVDSAGEEPEEQTETVVVRTVSVVESIENEHVHEQKSVKESVQEHVTVPVIMTVRESAATFAESPVEEPEDTSVPEESSEPESEPEKEEKPAEPAEPEKEPESAGGAEPSGDEHSAESVLDVTTTEEETPEEDVVSIYFSSPESEVPVLTDAAAEDLPSAETVEETVPAAETNENAEETGEMPENFIPGEEAEDIPEEDPLQDPAEKAPDEEYVPVEGTDPDTDPDAVPVEPDGSDSEETAAEPLTVRIVASCEEGFQPGARIVLTAVVSDPDYEGTIRWQYSADGGMTICDVEDADGREYSFLLDEENIMYLWRACLE